MTAPSARPQTATSADVDIIDVVQHLQPGDVALIYLATGWTPPDRVPPDVVDVIDDLGALQPGDTALIYQSGPDRGLVSGTVASVTTGGRKRRDRQVTFTAPVSGDLASAEMSVTPDAFVSAYRVNQSRVDRRVRRDADRHGVELPTQEPAPSIVAGVVGRVEPWGLTWAGHLISYTAPVLADGSYQFPVSGESSYAFISAYRATV